MNKIDWHLLSEAISFYQRRGYRYLEVPWIVSEAALNMTVPSMALVMKTAGGGLVGSSEQSFLELERIGKLERGRYVALTPCFRNEAHLDEFHQTHFMKVELYQNDGVDEFGLECVIADATDFFRFHSSHLDFINRVKTREGFDLTLHDVEIGSYGIREVEGYRWVYGTGLAEPRFSTVLAL